MKDILRLASVFFRVRYGLSLLRYNAKYDRKKFLRQIGIFIVIFFAFAELFGLYVLACHAMFKAVSAIGQGAVLPALGFIGSQLLTLLFGLFYILGFLFFAKDSELLASLPLSQRKVFSAKLLYVYAGEFGISFCICLPPVLFYALGTGTGVLTCLKALALTLFLPAVPLAIAALLSLLLMGVVSRIRHRERIATVAGLLLVVGVMVLQGSFNARMNHMDEAALQQMLLQSGGLAAFAGRLFPPSQWATAALTGSGLSAFGFFLLFLAVSVAALALLILIAGKIYYKGSLAQFETPTARGKAKKLIVRAGSPVRAIYLREFKTLLRSSVYAMNSLSIIVIAPVMIVFLKFSGQNSGADFRSLLAMAGPEATFGLLFVIAAVALFFAACNPAASTAFSREGKTFWLAKSIPVPAEVQTRAKLLSAYTIAVLTVLLTVGACAYAFSLPAGIAAGAALLACLVSFSVTAANLFVDLMRPKLGWESEQEAMKQNFNSLIGMGAGILVAAVPIALGGLLWYFHAAAPAVAAAVTAVSVFLAVLLYRLLLAASRRAFARIEL